LTEEKAIELALEIERTEAELKLMKVNVKAYVHDSGQLQAGDNVWGYFQQIA